MSVNRLLSVAIKEARKLLSGEVFLVQDLFQSHVWNQVHINDRRMLGRLFLNEVISSYMRIAVLDKTSLNQQRYHKL